MIKLFLEAKCLAKEATELTELIAQHNPGIESKGKLSLATIAASTGTLAYRYNNLRVDIIRKYEENQQNDIDSDS